MTAEDAKRMRDSGLSCAWFVAVLDSNKHSHYIVRIYDSEKIFQPDGSADRDNCAVCGQLSLAAKTLYERFRASRSAVIYGLSAGWGGRLFGRSR